MALKVVDNPEVQSETPETDELAEATKKREALKSSTPAFHCPGNFWKTMHPSDIYPVPVEDTFKTPEGAGVAFIPAEDIEHVAGLLCERHTEHLGHLKNFTVAYRWQAEGGKHQGRPRWGMCRKTAGLLKEFSGVDFIVTIAADHCRDRITCRQMEALIYHELCHAEATDDYRPRIQPHDFEGFLAELKEYGSWNQDLEMAAGYMSQMSLFEDQAEVADHGD